MNYDESTLDIGTSDQIDGGETPDYLRTLTTPNEFGTNERLFYYRR